MPPSNRVIEVNEDQFKRKYGSDYKKAIVNVLVREKIDLSRTVSCIRDPNNKEVMIFWQALPNEFLTDVNGKIL